MKFEEAQIPIFAFTAGSRNEIEIVASHFASDFRALSRRNGNLIWQRVNLICSQID
jgi:hypothetical protein